MRTLLFLLALCVAGVVRGAAPYVVEGGRSPDGRWAVAVLSDRTGAEAMDAEEDHPREQTAWLIRAKTRRIVAPLPEVPTDGGSWGRTRENVTALWNPGGRFVAVRFRAGRAMHAFYCYMVAKSGRVRLQKLPGGGDSPKWRDYQRLGRRNNGATVVERWTSPTGLIVQESGVYLPEGIEEPVAAWLEGFSDVLEWVYAYEGGRWVLKDIRVPAEKP